MQANILNDYELIIELKKPKPTIGKIFLVFFLSLIPIGIIVLLNVQNGPIVGLVIFLSIATNIFYGFYLRYHRHYKGYYLKIQNELIFFLDIKSKKEILTTTVSNINTDVYIIEVGTSRTYNLFYLTLKLKIPNFKNITISQFSSFDTSEWEGKNLRTKRFFYYPDYIIPEKNWIKLAHAFNINI